MTQSVPVLAMTLRWLQEVVVISSSPSSSQLPLPAPEAPKKPKSIPTHQPCTKLWAFRLCLLGWESSSLIPTLWHPPGFSSPPQCPELSGSLCHEHSLLPQCPHVIQVVPLSFWHWSHLPCLFLCFYRAGGCVLQSRALTNCEQQMNVSHTGHCAPQSLIHQLQ